MTGPQIMATDAKPPLTPKRRFPAFRDSATWKEKSLHEAVSPVVRETEKPAMPYKALGVRSHGKGTFIKDREDPKKNAMDHLYEVKPRDLIVNITFAWEGAIAIATLADDGALVSHRFPTYTFKLDVAIPDFFKYIIPTKKFVYDLGVISPGGAGRNRVLNKNDFLKLTTFLPDVDEQQKIAECLGTLDELIGAESQKLDALKDHKKGLMQQLFPREGETVPRLRFPEFQNNAAWRQRRLADVAELNPPNRGLPDIFFYIDLEAVEGGTLKTRTLVSKSAAPSRAQRLLTVGDVIFQTVRPYLKNNLSFNLHDSVPFVASTGYAQLRAHESGAFLYHALYTDDFVGRVIAQSTGSSYPAINSSDLAAIPLTIPSPAEQQRVASCLSSIDDLISAQSDKLEALMTHKKGLIQQLFPSPAGAEA